MGVLSGYVQDNSAFAARCADEIAQQLNDAEGALSFALSIIAGRRKVASERKRSSNKSLG
jgi:hypothetical protein